MPTDTDVDLIINELTKAQYNTSTKDPNQLYMVTDDDHYATSEQLNELDASKQDVIDSSHKLSADLVSDGTTNKVVTQTEKTAWNNKQDALVSGTNIKTINSTSILGSGNISVATAAQGTKADTVSATIATYGNIVTHNVSEFATSAQGAKADTAVQPNDNITTLINNAGYITGITGAMVTNALGYTPYNSTNPSGYQNATQVNTAITSYHDTSKQDTLVSGTNIKTINGNSVLGSGDLTISGLPSQSGQSGKFLTTNGTTASWDNIPQDSTKANVSADNFTATAKETIVGWGMPDYSAGVSKTKNTDYEAEFDGILICCSTTVASGGARDWITVDGQVVSVSTNSFEGYRTSMFALIQKGSSFRITQNSGGTWTHTFYPLKGVV